MEKITFNLPYKVKIVKKRNNESVTNFSIIIIIKDNEKLIANLILLEEFKKNQGELFILNLSPKYVKLDTFQKCGSKIEDGSSFLRIIDDDMAELINEKFNYDNGIITKGDTYYDYSSAKNYITTLASNDMVLMIDGNFNFINFNLLEIEKYIEEGYDLINFTNHNKKNNIFKFYNREKFTWINNNNEELIATSEKIKKIDIPESTLKLESLIKKEIIDKNILIGLSIDCFLNLCNDTLSQLFAIELMKHGFLNSSYKEFIRHLSICNSSDKRSESMVYIGDYFIKIGRDSEGLEYYNKAYLEYCDKRLPLYKLGEYFFLKRDWSRSIFYLEGCLNIPASTESDKNDFMYKDGPYSMLYVAYWWFDDKKKGKYYFDKAIEIDPYNKLYIDEAIYHYEYKSNNIQGSLSFQELQYLYNESKKAKSILEIYPKNSRATHALVNGCTGLITVIMKNEDSFFLESVENPGNVRILNMTSGEAIKFLESENEKFDIIFINDNYDEIIKDHDPYWGILIWEKFANKLICGSSYNKFKKTIDDAFDISGIENNIWYKNISSFEKITIYKKI